MKSFLLVFSTLFFSQVYAQDIYMVHNSTENVLVMDAKPFNIAGGLNSTVLGLCFDKNGCKKEFLISEAYQKNIALMNGVIDLNQEQKDSMPFPVFPVEISTRIVKDEGEMLTLETEDESSSRIMAQKLPLKINFNHTVESTSRRKDFSEVANSYKKYHKSVFQIVGEDVDDGLGGSGSEHGTGFFITKSGYALSNLHVMEIYPKCIDNRSCKMTIQQKSDLIKEYSVNTRVLTCSKINDFCLIKIQLPTDLEILPLQMELNSISKNLFTLGFPGDKTADFLKTESEGINDIALTYSFGSPIGFSGSAITSTVYINGGASGSPIIDEETGKVVGLNSNGAQSFVGPDSDGFPAIFRSLLIIDRDFQIKDYLSGEKQKRIEEIIQKLGHATSVSETNGLLLNLTKEKSFYGRSKLEVLSFNHPNPELRKSIVKYLKNMKGVIW